MNDKLDADAILDGAGNRFTFNIAEHVTTFDAREFDRAVFKHFDTKANYTPVEPDYSQQCLGLHREEPRPERGYANGLVCPTQNFVHDDTERGLGWHVMFKGGTIPDGTVITYCTRWFGERCTWIEPVDVIADSHNLCIMIGPGSGKGYRPTPPSGIR